VSSPTRSALAVVRVTDFLLVPASAAHVAYFVHVEEWDWAKVRANDPREPCLRLVAERHRIELPRRAVLGGTDDVEAADGVAERPHVLAHRVGMRLLVPFASQVSPSSPASARNASTTSSVTPSHGVPKNISMIASVAQHRLRQ
jgi:hypothetical protein